MSPYASIDVLLVEDDPTAVLIARDLLEDVRLFRVQHAERLSLALDVLSGASVDVVLLDLGLPDSQGLETLLRVRAGRPDVPVVVMTSRDDEDLALQAVHAGAQDYLVKSSVQEGVLTRAIRYAIERHESATALREGAVLRSVIADAGLAFTSGGSLDDTLGVCTESVVRSLDMAITCIWTHDEERNGLRLQASAGMTPDPHWMPDGVETDPSVIAAVASTRQAIIVNDLDGELGLADLDWARQLGLSAFAAYPMLVEDRLVGVIALLSRRQFSPPLLQAMSTLANHVALGIEGKRIEDTLRRVNRTLESLLDAAPVAIVVTDHDGKIQRWNRAAEAIFGWIEAEVRGRPLPFVIDGVEARLLQGVADPADEPATLGSEYKLARKDGTLVDVALWTALVRDDRGRAVASMGLMSDRTERRHLEEKFRQAQKMEAIGRLAGGIAHDFNNLLTIIEGNNELLARKLPSDNPLQEYVGEVHQAVTRAAALTRQLLAFSRKQVLEPRVLNLNDLVTNLQKMLGRLIGEDVLLSCGLDPGLGNVRADAGQIEQVLMNLAVNARDAMPRGGRLTIETHNVQLDESYTSAYSDLSPGEFVMLAVSDTGTGMDEATKRRVFEPFFTTKGVGQGTGLGLATIYGIVKQSGGHVAVYSEPGQGASFKVYLPRVDAPAANLAPPTALNDHNGTETILLAEDEPSLRMLTRRVLEMHGYTVLEAKDGAEALRVAEAFEGVIDMVITDVVMPEVSGSDLAAHLERLRPGIRVLFVSGYTDDAVVRHGVLRARTAFLQKPFTPDALASKVREVLGRTAREQ